MRVTFNQLDHVAKTSVLCLTSAKNRRCLNGYLAGSLQQVRDIRVDVHAFHSDATHCPHRMCITVAR